VKATKLIDTKNTVSVDEIQERAQRIFLTYLDTTKTYKLKTGIIKIEDSLSLSSSDKNDNIEVENGTQYETSTLKDLSHEHLHKSQIYDNTILNRLLDADLYDYSYVDATMYNGELVHIIGYEPRRSKAKFEGVLYITDESYAVIKADYKYGKGKRGEKLNLKLLLGIKFVENVKQGTIIYGKEANYYQPKYIKEESGSYFYVNRPIKFIENSKQKRKVGFRFLIEGNNRNKNELLIVSQESLDRNKFEAFEETDKTPYQRLKQYDPTIWSEHTSLEPLQEMKTFKAEE
ncbi:MAG: carboxypeptidase-like regulatory domain-containing protein, partial [Bacteroidota bacterium]